MRTRKDIVRSLGLAFALAAPIALAPANTASADVYPSKPVRVIVPWKTGGSTDISMRSMLTVLGKYFPQPMVVINKPGAGGVIGSYEVISSKPDAYTVLFNSFSAFVSQPHLQDVPYDDNDYIPVLQVNFRPRILSAHPSAPFNDLKEMVAYAKANPGKVKVGFSGIGTTGHLAMVQLAQDYELDLRLVPFAGGGPTKTALLGGHVDVAPLNPPEVRPLLASDNIKALATMAGERNASVPDIPTSTEQGYPVESFYMSFVAVPNGTPEERIRMIHDAFKNSMEDKTLLKMSKNLDLGLEYVDGDATRARLKKFKELYGKLISTLGVENVRRMKKELKKKK